MINLKNIVKSYNNKLAVDHLSLEVQNGELCVLVGESGCGKSTTLRMINRLIDPDEGTIEIDGKDVFSYDPVHLRRSIGYVVQSTGLFPHLNVARNIGMVPELLKWDKTKTQTRIDELLCMVGLNPEEYRTKYPSQLSGGEAQRIGVARALAADPQIILMDEPFGAVDPINRSNLQNEFLKLQRQLQKTVIFVTHDMNEAIKMGDKIAIMSKGVLEGFDTPANLMNSKNEFINSFLGANMYPGFVEFYKKAGVSHE